jgi:hypothetical protein
MPLCSPSGWLYCEQNSIVYRMTSPKSWIIERKERVNHKVQQCSLPVWLFKRGINWAVAVIVISDGNVSSLKQKFLFIHSTRSNFDLCKIEMAYKCLYWSKNVNSVISEISSPLNTVLYTSIIICFEDVWFMFCRIMLSVILWKNRIRKTIHNDKIFAMKFLIVCFPEIDSLRWY